MKIRVYYEDTDAGGIVYHSNYLNFCERARSEVFYDRGMTPVLSHGHFVARRLSAEYISSAKLGDLLEVRGELLDMKAASFRLRQSIYLEEKKIFQLEITLAFITFDGKPQKIDVPTKELLYSLF